jgi:hypothetical protein
MPPHREDQPRPGDEIAGAWSRALLVKMDERFRERMPKALGAAAVSSGRGARLGEATRSGPHECEARHHSAHPDL